VHLSLFNYHQILTSYDTCHPHYHQLGVSREDPIRHVPCLNFLTIGTCGAGVQDIYRNNATLGDSRGNMLWFREGMTDGNGTLFGSAPNVFVPRWPNSTTNGLQSLLLVPNPADSEWEWESW
jgi:hypothetical protein